MRNGSGTFAVLNPVLVGADRSSSEVNENFEDAGDEITNTLPADGTAGMTGQFKAAAGTRNAPGLSFVVDRDTGIRRAGANDSRMVVGGLDRVGVSASGASFYTGLQASGTVSFDGALTGTVDLPAIEALEDVGLIHRPADNTAELDLMAFVIPIDIENKEYDIPAGIRSDIVVSFPYIITGIGISADQAGSMVMDLWKDTFANYPPTVADSICGSNPPTLDESATYYDLTLTGWTVTVEQGMTLRVNIESLDNIRRLSISLRARRF